MFQSQLDYVCDYCSRTFTRKYNLQTHIENHHTTCNSLCEICNQSFGTPNGLQLHLSRGHNRYGQQFPECDICGRIFTRKQNIVSHMITVHLQGLGSEIICKYCDKTFSSKKNLKRHKNQLHNPNLEYVTCSDCNKVYKGRDLLASHIDNMHNIEISGSVRCHICKKVFLNARYLKRHVDMVHLEKNDHKCELCPKFYTSNSGLKRHMKSVHNIKEDNTEVSSGTPEITINRNAETVMYCETCNKSFQGIGKLRFHIKVHHSFKVFYKYCLRYTSLNFEDTHSLSMCEFCSADFTTVSELQTHMKACHQTEYHPSTCNVCFNKFFSKETRLQHGKICLPPPDVNKCNYCDKLFTDVSSLEFHTKIFHPQAVIAVYNITSTNTEETESNSYKCTHCDRFYYNERSLKQHVKLKHCPEESMECMYCGKMYTNRYYLASHVKMVHSNGTWLKCDYCQKYFKSKRNIRRHIEYTHLNIQRFKCIECQTLFKEKRSLRKHVRTKHADSAMFPQCHICYMRFESAKSCKIHLKLLHSYNMNTHPCDLCSVSFNSNDALLLHLRKNHPGEDKIYKCDECNLILTGIENFSQHNEVFHDNPFPDVKTKVLPRCIICMKDFSTRKTLKRHIRKFHTDFDVDELATFGTKRRSFIVDCDECIKNINDEYYLNIYQKLKHIQGSVIFKCEFCKSAFNVIEFAVQRKKLCTDGAQQSKMMLSELCTIQMSDDDPACSEIGSTIDIEPVSTTTDIVMVEQDTCS